MKKMPIYFCMFLSCSLYAPEFEDMSEDNFNNALNALQNNDLKTLKNILKDHPDVVQNYDVKKQSLLYHAVKSDKTDAAYGIASQMHCTALIDELFEPAWLDTTQDPQYFDEVVNEHYQRYRLKANNALSIAWDEDNMALVQRLLSLLHKCLQENAKKNKKHPDIEYYLKQFEDEFYKDFFSDTEQVSREHPLASFSKKDDAQEFINILNLAKKLGYVDFINQKDFTHKSPLLYGAVRSSPELLEALLNQGNLNLQVVDNQGNNALHYALYYFQQDKNLQTTKAGRINFIKMLLDHGINLQQKGYWLFKNKPPYGSKENPLTPLQLAQALKCDSSIIELLEEALLKEELPNNLKLLALALSKIV